MSDDSEVSACFDSSESEMENEDSGEDWGVIESEIIPYQDEPLAVNSEETGGGDSEEERDVDGLTPAVLESRYEGSVSVESW